LRWTQKHPVASGTIAYIHICHARLLLSCGETAAALQSLQRSDLLYAGSFGQTLFARILLAQGCYQEAFQKLEQLFIIASKAKKIGTMIETQMLLALASQKLERKSESLEFLERALSLAEAGGYFRLLMDEGACMTEAIEAFIDVQQHRDYQRSPALINYGKKLLEALKDYSGDPIFPQSNIDKFIRLNLTLAEPLKEREIEILYLIAIGLSNQEIAQKLVVAITTIKWHIKNIYGKLNIRSRAEAIALVHKQIITREE
jgi:LuxR family maltose regulon positive regulatory protein